MIYHGGDHLGDCEGSILLWCQFGRGVREFEIGPLQPDFFSQGVGFEGSFPTLLFIVFEGQLLGVLDCFLGAITQLFQKCPLFLDCREFGFYRRQSMQGGSEPSGGARPSVVYVLSQGKPLDPVILLIINVNSQILFQPLVCLLRLALCVTVFCTPMIR